MGQLVLGFVMFGAGVVLLRLLSGKASHIVQRFDGATEAVALFVTILLTMGGGLILQPLFVL